MIVLKINVFSYQKKSLPLPWSFRQQQLLFYITCFENPLNLLLEFHPSLLFNPGIVLPEMKMDDDDEGLLFNDEPQRGFEGCNPVIKAADANLITAGLIWSRRRSSSSRREGKKVLRNFKGELMRHESCGRIWIWVTATFNHKQLHHWLGFKCNVIKWLNHRNMLRATQAAV